MQNISIEAAKAKGFISGYRVGRIILACSIEPWKYGKLLKELREDCRIYLNSIPDDAHDITTTPSRYWKKSRDISSTATGILAKKKLMNTAIR